MTGTKRGLALLLASLQVALSWGLPAYAAAAQIVAQPVQTVVPIQTGPSAPVSGMKLGGPGSLQTGSLSPVSALSGPGAMIGVPQVNERSFSAPVIGLPASAITLTAAPGQTTSIAVQNSPASLTISKTQLAAPAKTFTPTADGQAGPIDIQKTSARVQTSLELPGLSQKAPAETSRDAAEQVFAELRNEKLAETTEGAVSAPVSALGIPGTPLARAKAAPAQAKPTEVPAVHTQAAKSLWQSPTVRWIAAGLAAVGLAAAAPILVSNVGLVAAAGSVTLTLLGVPQIIKNFKSGPAGTKDVVMAGPLMWMAAAGLLTLVGIGNGSSIWWNLANVAGLAESAVVVGQLNYHKKDKGALKATLTTAAAVAIPIALIASQAVMPLSVGLNLAFTGAMVLLGALDAPQIRQNDAIFRNEGRAPQGISPWFKGLLVAGSLMHLFAALVGGDARWALNAAIAITMGSTVLAQMYAPKAAHAVLGPIVRGAEKLASLFKRGASVPSAEHASLAEAKALIDKQFQGTDYMRFQSQDSAQALASIQEKAQALPGRSAILLEAPTAAGKSTLAEAMNKGLNGRMVVFPVDLYFRSYGDIPLDPMGRPDYDRPEALYLQRAAQDVKTLLEGGRVELPKHVMDGPTTFDSGNFLRLGPDDVVIVDSIFASHRYFLEAVKGHQTLNVYLAAPAAIRLARRLKRDKNERGITVHNNLKGWSHLLVNERANILPLREKADAVINLMSAQELANLPQAYAELLAAEWAANNHDAAATELFLKMIQASIEADDTPGPLPADPEKLMRQVDVVGDMPEPARLKTLVAKALETYTAVQKEAAETPNFSNFHVHAAVELSDGRWVSAPNVELSREVTLCAERTAILAALADAPAGTKVKTVVVSNSGGEFKKLCAECLSWLATGKFFSPDTEVVSVARDPATGRVAIRVRTLKSILPYHLAADRQPSLSDKPVSSLEVSLSQAAAAAGASASTAKALTAQAAKTYGKGAADKFSAKPSAAAVRLSDSRTASAVRFQWAARFSEYEDLGAASQALEASAKRRALIARVAGFFGLKTRSAPPSIEAIAYYGQDADLPPIASIGRLTRQGAGPNTLIIRIEDGRVVVRTLGEYMTEIYDRH
ncbi:MAG: hypothetical protein HY926_09515 [Elusimicrobia bacterium]|nr:hypothetical protein [Elusimicrobiota bacterium]